MLKGFATIIDFVGDMEYPFAMSKILLFSDLHCHMHKSLVSRLDDCLQVLTWVFKTALDRNIKTIVFAGDLFQDREKIHVISYEKTFRAIKEFCLANPDVNLFILVGNHDMWYHSKWDVSSVAPLDAISNVKVVNQPCSLKIAEDCSADFLPYTKNPLVDIKEHFTKKNDILISHLSVDGAKMNTYHKAEVSVEYEGDMVKVDMGIFTGWRKVFLGHFHSAQKLNDVVEYIGSPLELNFSEAHQEKHIIVFDTKTFDEEYIINDFSPKHLVIHEKDLDKHELKNNFVQVIVNDIASVDVLDMKKKVKSRKYASLEFKEPARRKEISQKDGDKKTTLNLSDGDILMQWIKAKCNLDANVVDLKGHDIDGLDAEKLLTIAQDIVRKGQS